MISVMGVLNVTPDSFSDGGQNFDRQRAVARGLELAAHGATVIDVGGESTRPGADPVDPEVEQARVLPVIEELRAALDGPTGHDGASVRISIDTRNPATARAAIRVGADIINDVSAQLWQVAADCGVGWVAMHMLGDPRTMQVSPHYDDVVVDVRDFLVQRAGRAARAGVEEIWIDPGIGFGKNTRHNLELLAGLDALVSTGIPVLIGTSRKRFLGELTALSDAGTTFGQKGPTVSGTPGSAVDDRIEASVATAVWAMTKGAAMVRVHDVRATVEAVAVVERSIPTS